MVYGVDCPFGAVAAVAGSTARAGVDVVRHGCSNERSVGFALAALSSSYRCHLLRLLTKLVSDVLPTCFCTHAVSVLRFKGIMRTPDGTVYQGDFEEGLPHGKVMVM